MTAARSCLAPATRICFTSSHRYSTRHHQTRAGTGSTPPTRNPRPVRSRRCSDCRPSACACVSHIIHCDNATHSCCRLGVLLQAPASTPAIWLSRRSLASTVNPSTHTAAKANRMLSSLLSANSVAPMLVMLLARIDLCGADVRVRSPMAGKQPRQAGLAELHPRQRRDAVGSKVPRAHGLKQLPFMQQTESTACCWR